MTYVYAQIHIHIYRYIYVYIYTHIYIYTYTYTCTLLYAEAPPHLTLWLAIFRAQVTIADPQREDCPLIAVSDEFLTMTGYFREEVVGNWADSWLGRCFCVQFY